MCINGHFIPGKSRDSIAVVNPATEEIIAEVPRGTGEDAYAAVKAANSAFKEWRDMLASARASSLHQIASKI